MKYVSVGGKSKDNMGASRYSWLQNGACSGWIFEQQRMLGDVTQALMPWRDASLNISRMLMWMENQQPGTWESWRLSEWW